MTVVRLENVTKRYGKTLACDNISFTVNDGEIVAIVGPTGSGKSTLLRVITGEYAPEKGKIFFDNEEINEVPIEKRGIGIVYQNYALFPHMNVFENVAYGLRIRKLPEEEIEETVNHYLELVGLIGKEKSYPSELSGGEKQRVALARALVTKPKLLLLDEAFNALDANTHDRLIIEVRKFIRNLNLTTIFVTHNQEEAMAFADKIAVLDKGKIAEFGTPKEILNSKSKFVSEFVSINQVFTGKVDLSSPDGAYIVLDDGTMLPTEIKGLRNGEEVKITITRTEHRLNIAEIERQKEKEQKRKEEIRELKDNKKKEIEKLEKVSTSISVRL